MKKILLFTGVVFLLSCQGRHATKVVEEDSLAFLKVSPREMTPAFSPVRLGEIKPEGWLKAQIERDVTGGLVAFLDRLTPEEMNDDLFGSTRRGQIPDSLKGSWRKELMWWRAEQQGYWWDGLLRNAILAGHQPSLNKMQNIIRHLLATQDSDGYMGIYRPEARFSNEDGNGELWAQARLTFVLLTWYEYSGDSNCLQAVKKSVDCTMRAFNEKAKNPFHTELYGGASHGLMYAETVAWLYRITGEEKYRDYAVWLYRAYCESKPYDNDIHYTFLKDSSFNFIGHSAHTFEHLRVLLNTWYFTGSPRMAELYANYRHKLNKVILPSGAGFGFENMWGEVAHPDSAPVEYCDITELQLSSTYAFRLTGDISWADMAEKIFFNAAQGARLPNGKAVTYCKPDNCLRLDGIHAGYKKHAYEVRDQRYKYSPTHLDVAECCAPQSSRVYPFYVSSMWMKYDKGLLASLLGPCVVTTTVGNQQVSVTEETRYPFDDSVVFVMNTATAGTLELKIRIPLWTNGEYKITAGGAEVKKEQGYCTLVKQWNKGDKVILSFAPQIVLRKAFNGEGYLQRGPLVFALPIAAKEKHIKEWPVKGFYDSYFLLREVPVVSYAFDGLAGPDAGFKMIKEKVPAYPWDVPSVKLVGKMINGKGKKEEVSMVPIGATILRKVTFPVKQ